MAILDLTVPIPGRQQERTDPDSEPRSVETMATRVWDIDSAAGLYRARVHYFEYWGMSGTYIDFPGHIIETDDGADSATVSPERLFRREALVLRPREWEDEGGISRDMLLASCPQDSGEPAVVVNALGGRRYDEIPERSVYLTSDAAEWLVARGTELLVSDVYESNLSPQNVFQILFRGGVMTVCYPESLGQIDADYIRVTALPLRFPGATQLPCRLLVEQRIAP